MLLRKQLLCGELLRDIPSCAQLATAHHGRRDRPHEQLPGAHALQLLLQQQEKVTTAGTAGRETCVLFRRLSVAVQTIVWPVSENGGTIVKALQKKGLFVGKQ